MRRGFSWKCPECAGLFLMGELCVDTGSPFLWWGWGWRRVGATGWIRSEPSMRLAAGVLFAWGLVPAGGCAAGFLQAARRAAGGSAAVRRGQGGERCGTAGAGWRALRYGGCRAVQGGSEGAGKRAISGGKRAIRGGCGALSSRRPWRRRGGRGPCGFAGAWR